MKQVNSEYFKQSENHRPMKLNINRYGSQMSHDQFHPLSPFTSTTMSSISEKLHLIKRVENPVVESKE